MVASIIILFLIVFNLGMEIVQHKKEKEGRHNFWITLASSIIALILYYSAGLFNNF